MSVLGKPYRVMYLSRGVTGLTNVGAMVYKPDNTFAGVFPLVELQPPLQGSYSFDYLSSTEDREGEYFCIVRSPTEDVRDITRFSLYKQSAGNEASLTPVDIVGIVQQEVIYGAVFNQSGVDALLHFENVTARFELSAPHILATIEVPHLSGTLESDETIAYSRDNKSWL